MANERTYPCLPCRDIDVSIGFYEAVGFARTFRQVRPNPYAVVALDDIQIHLFGIDGFDPTQSYGSAIVVVPDPDGLYRTFAAGFRSMFGKLPVAGIPRILRPRKKFGTVRGFTVVDPGGNWLRFYRLGDAAADDGVGEGDGLAHMIDVAARLGDARGDDRLALRTIENGLHRYVDADPFELAKAHLYRAELAVRIGDLSLAQDALETAKSVALTVDQRGLLADELAHVAALVRSERSGLD